MQVAGVCRKHQRLLRHERPPMAPSGPVEETHPILWEVDLSDAYCVGFDEDVMAGAFPESVECQQTWKVVVVDED